MFSAAHHLHKKKYLQLNGIKILEIYDDKKFYYWRIKIGFEPLCAIRMLWHRFFQEKFLVKHVNDDTDKILDWD